MEETQNANYACVCHFHPLDTQILKRNFTQSWQLWSKWTLPYPAAGELKHITFPEVNLVIFTSLLGIYSKESLEILTKIFLKGCALAHLCVCDNRVGIKQIILYLSQRGLPWWRSG